MHDDGFQILIQRGKNALKLGLATFTACTLAYYVVGCLIGMNAGYGRSLWSLSDDMWTWDECMYATGITLTTVGYTDLLGTEKIVFLVDKDGHYRLDANMDEWVDERGFDEESAEVHVDWSSYTKMLTVAQVVVGISFFLYVIAQMTAFFAEGGYEEIRAARRNRILIAKMSGHYILCGAGGPGMFAALDFFREDAPFMCIEPDPESIKRLRVHWEALRRKQPRGKRRPLVFLRADAHDDDVLRTAGIERAKGICLTLPTDKDNLILTVTARYLNPNLEIVTRGIEEFHKFGRLGKAGAKQVVSANFLGGLRIASELIRPAVVKFLDVPIYGGPAAPVLIESARMEAGSPWIGRSLGESELEAKTAHQVLALHQPDQSWIFNPGPDELLKEGTAVVVVCNRDSLERLRRFLNPPPPHVAPSGGSHG